MKIAFLGTGLLGFPMAERLLDAGHDLFVYNRTQSKATPLKSQGAHVLDNPIDCILKSECIIFVLSDAEAISNVLFSKENISFKNKTFIQMGTIAPSESIELQKKIFDLGGEYFECPVLGSRKEVANSELILMFGGTKEKFDHWEEFLQVFGNKPRYIGDVGKAAALKLALNHLIAVHALGFSLSLGLIQKNGVSVDEFMDLLRTSALYAPMYDKKLNNWVSHDYGNPNFPLKHLLKDVHLILNEAEEKNLCTDVLQSMEHVLFEAKNKGFAEKDYSSIYEYINNSK